MAVKLRLTRVGKTKQPQYRIVAADSRSPRDGRFIEILGHYNPRTEPSTLTVDNDKAVKWLSDGAQPTERVRKLLEISGALDEFGAADGRDLKAPCAHRVDAHPERVRRQDTGEYTADDVNTSTIGWRRRGDRGAAPIAAAVLTHIVASIVDDPDAVERRGRTRRAGSASTCGSAPATSAG